MTAETKHGGRRDKVAEERELRRLKARKEEERRTEKRLKTLERRMKDDERRIAAMEKELTQLPSVKTRQQLAHEWAHMEDSPRTSRSDVSPRAHGSSPRSESAPARSSPLPDDEALLGRAATSLQKHERRRRASAEVSELRRVARKRLRSVLNVAASSAVAVARDASRTCVLYAEAAVRSTRMLHARRAYDAIYLLQRFARFVRGQAALALAAEVLLLKQKRLCRRVESMHGKKQRRIQERETTDRLATCLQNAARRRVAKQELARRYQHRNEVLKRVALVLAQALQKHARRRFARRRANSLRQRWRGRRKLVSLDLEGVSRAVLRPANLESAYGAAWAALGIDGALLADPELDEADLEELGVAVRLHRRRLLKDIARLRAQGVPEDVLRPTPREEPSPPASPKRAACAAGPEAPLPRKRAVPRSVAAARAAEEAAAPPRVAAPRKTAAAFVPKQSAAPAPRQTTKAAAPAAKAAPQQKAAPRAAAAKAPAAKATASRPAASRQTVPKHTAPAKAAAPRRTAAPAKAATKTARAAPRPAKAGQAVPKQAVAAKAPRQQAAPRRAAAAKQRRASAAPEPAPPARRPLADAANAAAAPRPAGRDAEVAAARERAAARKARGTRRMSATAPQPAIPAEAYARARPTESVFAGAGDSSDSDREVPAATYPRAAAAASGFERGDDEDDGIPAEPYGAFRGSVLEDDGFFEDDDFEVAAGEDVADLFA